MDGAWDVGEPVTDPHPGTSSQWSHPPPPTLPSPPPWLKHRFTGHGIKPGIPVSQM